MFAWITEEFLRVLMIRAAIVRLRGIFFFRVNQFVTHLN
jgi:hypothetical protein